MGMGEEALHRVFIGGLYNEVTENDVRGRFESFGEVSDVTIVQKKDGEGCITKTFGYVNLKTTTSKLNKCFAVYGGTTWKGSQLKVQLAKENFISKLERERAEPPPPVLSKKKRKQCAAPAKTYSDIMDTASSMKKIVPGVPVEGEKNWVIGKYGRPLPVVYIPKVSGRKTTKVDPSKFCHCLRKIGDVDVGDKGIGNLSWSYDDEEIVPRKKKKKRERKPSENDDDDVAKTTEKTITDCSDEKCDTDANISIKIDKKKKKRSDELIENVPSSYDGVTENGQKDNSENTLDVEPTGKTKETVKPCKKKKREKTSEITPEITDSSTVINVVTNSTKKRKKVKEKEDPFINASLVDDHLPSSPTPLPATDNSIHSVESASPNENINSCNSNSEYTDDTPEPNRKLGTSIIEQLAAKKRNLASQPMTDKETNKDVSSADEDEDVDDSDNGGTFNMFDFDLESLGGNTNSTFLSSLLMNSVEVRDEGNVTGSQVDSDSDEDSEEDSGSDSENGNDDTDDVSYSRSDTVGSRGAAEVSEMKTEEATSTDSKEEEISVTENNETTAVLKAKKSKKLKKTEANVEDHVPTPVNTDTNKIAKKDQLDTTLSTKKTVTKQEKHAHSEEQRTKSLLARTNELADQKSAVTKALKDVDKAGTNINRIVFESEEEDEEENEVMPEKKLWSDDEETEEEEKKADAFDQFSKTTGTGKQLFDEDSGDEDDDEILIKPQFQGKEGEKLFKMQQRFGGDERFKLDERFAEDELEQEPEKVDESVNDLDGDDGDTEDLQKEKEMNLSVLEQVLGKPLAMEKKKSNFDAPMQRYDPSNIDHEKFEVKLAEKPSKQEKHQDDDEDGLMMKKPSKPVEQQPLPEVSKETFYSVDNSIQDLFKKNEEQSTFSFFGSQEDESQTEEKDLDEKEAIEVDLEDVEESMKETKKALKEPSWKKGLEAISKMGDTLEDKMNVEEINGVDTEGVEDEESVDKRAYLWFSDGDPRLEIGKKFVRTESMEEITNQWKTLRKTFTEDYKKKHKNALRRVRKMREKRFNRR